MSCSPSCCATAVRRTSEHRRLAAACASYISVERVRRGRQDHAGPPGRERGDGPVVVLPEHRGVRGVAGRQPPAREPVRARAALQDHQDHLRVELPHRGLPVPVAVGEVGEPGLAAAGGLRLGVARSRYTPREGARDDAVVEDDDRWARVELLEPYRERVGRRVADDHDARGLRGSSGSPGGRPSRSRDGRRRTTVSVARRS